MRPKLTFVQLGQQRQRAQIRTGDQGANQIKTQTQTKTSLSLSRDSLGPEKFDTELELDSMHPIAALNLIALHRIALHCMHRPKCGHSKSKPEALTQTEAQASRVTEAKLRPALQRVFRGRQSNDAQARIQWAIIGDRCESLILPVQCNYCSVLVAWH